MSESDDAMGIEPEPSGETWPGIVLYPIPMSEWEPANWRTWLDYQLSQPITAIERTRLTLLLDALNRYTRTAQQFAEWWGKREQGA